MEQRKTQLLVIDDSRADVAVLRAFLHQARPGNVEIVHCLTAEAGLQTLHTGAFDCIFLDYVLEDADGLDILREIRASGNDVQVIAFSGAGSEQVAVEALKLGAQDYMVKGSLNPQAIERALSNAIEKVSLARLLAEKQQELQRFASVAAHDMRTPLGLIAALTELLQEHLEGRLDEESDQYLQSISSNAHRMQQLLDSLLEYAQAGRSQKPLTPVELDDVAAAALENLELAIREAGATVGVQALPTVLGDAVPLIQLFQNLVANAIKFRGDRAPVVTLGAEAREGWWRVAVSDNGIGIDPASCEAIFAPFHRLHAPSEYAGCGIGLATCKRIVDQHGGRIEVASEPGRGTTFYVTLPMLSAGQAHADHAGKASDAPAPAAPSVETTPLSMRGVMR